MIAEKTVFVVGAGASHSYGFPLANQIRRAAAQLKESPAVYAMAMSVIDRQVLDRTLQDIAEHPAQTIDDYLEQRRHIPDIFHAGKIILAAFIGVSLAQRAQAIREGIPRPANDDWLLKVITEIGRGTARASDFVRSAENVSFITFNFDSVIKEEAKRAIDQMYRGDDVRAVTAALDAIHVIHLHGRLDYPPNTSMWTPHIPHPGYNAFGIHQGWIPWVQTAADRIHVVSDEIDEGLRRKAATLIEEATTVCLLGFAYSSPNLQKLGLPQSMAGAKRRFGTAFGLSNSERQRVYDIAPGIELGGSETMCRKLFDDYYILREGAWS